MTLPLVLVLVVFASAALGKDCLECICAVESNCKNPGCNMDLGSLSCGPYQIKLPYYIDCGTPEKKDGESTETAWKRCAQNKKCAETCIKKYFDRYKGACAGSGQSDCEIMARNHNGGPQGCNKAGTEGYWTKIKDQGCS